MVPVNDLDHHASVLLVGISGSGIAPELGLGSGEVVGTEGRTCPVHKGAEESLEYCITDVVRVNSVTGVPEETVIKGIVHRQFPQQSTIPDLIVMGCV